MLDELQKSRATLNVLAIGTPSADQSDEMRNRNLVIAEGTERTGGRRDQLLSVISIPDRLKQLADDLLSQYVVTYSAPETLIPPQKVDVATKRSGVTVRARTRLAGKVMSTRTTLAVGGVIVALRLCAAGLAQQRFKAGVELVSLNVTVSDGSHYVTDLDQADFEVFEDGVKQDITFFTKVQQPIALSILLDTSASMEEKLPIAQEAAIGFVKRMRKEDVIEVVDFDSQVRILQGFTNDSRELEKAIRDTAVNGSTSLYNAIYISLKELKKIKAQSTEEIRRQAIVLLSDGDDTSSLVEYDEVLDLAKRSETAIYGIGLRQQNAGRRDFKEAEFVLRQLSQETGGRVFFPTQASELAEDLPADFR